MEGNFSLVGFDQGNLPEGRATSAHFKGEETGYSCIVLAKLSPVFPFARLGSQGLNIRTRERSQVTPRELPASHQQMEPATVTQAKVGARTPQISSAQLSPSQERKSTERVGRPVGRG